MSSDWKQVEQICQAALELKGEERETFLEETCGNDPALRQEVESLLAYETQSMSLIDRPALQVAAKELADSRRESLLGRRIGAYKIISFIGAGGMGEVYRAVDSRLNRTVAIKVLPSHLSQRADLRKRFEREARAISNLNHPHICTLHDIGEQDGFDFLVMEYLEGETLAQRLKRGRLPLEEVLKYGLQIGDALAQAHQQGVIHRDLKPGNIMLTARGAKLLDFGLAKLEREPQASGLTTIALAAEGKSLTAEGIIMGTLEYMAPEQLEGKEVDARSDVFSFGAVIYEMATGSKAFTGDSKASVIVAILTGQPPPMTGLQPLSPPELERLVEKCLRKEPRERWQNARDLAFELNRIVVTEPSDLVRVKTPVKESQPRPVSLNLSRWKWSGLAASVVLVALFVLWFTQRTPIPRVTRSSIIAGDRNTTTYRRVTDGVRLYYTNYSRFPEMKLEIFQVSTSGGEPTPIPTELPNPVIEDISPTGTELLVSSNPSTTSSDLPSFWILPLPSGPARRVGDLKGNWATWSRDGKQIAYIQGKELYLANIDGTGSHKIVTLPSDWNVCLRWSPDGSVLRFTSVQGATGGIWEVSVNGNNLHPLFPNRKKFSTFEGSWSFDGKYYYFMANDGVNPLTIWVRIEKAGFLNLETPGPFQLTYGPIPMQGVISSRDGKRIFAVAIHARMELNQYDLKTTRFAPYLGGISADRAYFSRDGEWVVYGDPLWRSKTDGSQRRQLIFPPMEADLGVVQWSPDNQQIAFSARAPGHPLDKKIYLISAEGGVPHQLMAEDRVEQDPMWFPDGNRLLFNYSEKSTDKPSTHVAWIDLKTNKVSLIPGSEGLSGSNLSWDGRYITATDVNSKKQNSPLLLFDFETQRWTTLVEDLKVGFGTWSHDNQYYYFISPSVHLAVYRVHIRDRKLEKVVDLSDFPVSLLANVPWFGLAPDDSLLIVRDTGTEDLYAFDLEY